MTSIRRADRTNGQLTATSRLRLINVAGLLGAAVGIVIQIASGVDYPRVPPGLILLLGTAALVIGTGWRWVTYLAVVVPLFLLVGGSIAPTGRNNLTDPGSFGPFIGTVIQMTAVVVAFAAGALALRTRSDRSRALTKR
jgi:hypothetical protein